jgi:hypothetical protein
LAEERDRSQGMIVQFNSQQRRSTEIGWCCKACAAIEL